MDKAIDEKENRRSRFPRLEILGLTIGVLTVAVSVYFGWQADKEKDLAIRYIAMVSLFTPQISSSGQVAITYDNKPVKRPHIFSARLVNIGNKPIETRDIEKPVLLRFKSASVLDVKIKERIPSNILVNAAFEEDTVTLDHGLLNPGDNIAFEVLFDGDPGWPDASARISGINELTILLPTDGGEGPFTTVFPMPRPVQYTILGLTTLGIVAVIVLSGIALWAGGSRVVNMYMENYVERFDHRIARLKLNEIGTFAVGGYELLSQLPSHMLLIDIDNEKWLSEAIQDSPNADVLEKIAGGPRGAAKMIVEKVKSRLPSMLAHHAYMELPVQVDTVVRARIRESEVGAQTVKEYVDRVREIIREATEVKGVWMILSSVRGEFVGGLTLLIFGGCAGVIIGGSWQSLLAG